MLFSFIFLDCPLYYRKAWLCASSSYYADILYIFYTHPQESVAHIRGAITVQVQDLAMFFWEHLMLDLIVIGKTLSRGEDEVSLLLSTVINNLSKQHNAGELTVHYS